MRYPQRHSSHSLEEKSISFFRQYVPNEWNINTIDRDYGQDLNIEISENGMFQGLDLVVQLKSSARSNITHDNVFERQRMKVASYNYLWNNLRVALIVKFIEEENEAYWILLKDVNAPTQSNKTFTLRIPRSNKLSKTDWTEIVKYVKQVTKRKLNTRARR